MNLLRRAILFMILSTMAFAVMNTQAKHLSEQGFSAYQLLFFRSLGTLMITMPYLVWKRMSIWGNKRGLLVLRGVAGAASLLLYFASLSHLPVGTAVVLRYLSPIFAAFIAVVWLKESVRPIQWLFFLLAFAGVLLIKGVGGDMSWLGLGLILSSAIILGLVFVSIAKIGTSDHPMVIINYFMAMGTILGGLLSIYFWKNPIGTQWWWLIGLGWIGFIGQLFMTKAFQMAATHQVAPLKYLEVLFTVMMGIVWFGEFYSLWALLGMVMVLTGLLLNMFFKSAK
ncbi:DMT family transporter [Nonlabens xiamenensis]|uniref:DMT family transporter n=1 Tax=Nonlabens xiamenensis TaxID=2341043 RepID=UPI001F0BB8C8|nr:DMT family transporter [Nonlabens xiamenensis]